VTTCRRHARLNSSGPLPSTNPTFFNSATSPRAAVSTSFPTTMHVRDATVGPLSGTIDVSGCAISTASTGTPSVSAAICAKIVLVPWPISVFDDSTRTRPSEAASSTTTEARWSSPDPVKPAPCMKLARPIPFLTRSDGLISSKRLRLA
jgi:hypothetical protein